MSCTIEDNHDATGNAASFWIVKKNPDKPDVRDNARFGGSIDTSKEDAAKATAFETTTNNTIQALLVPAPKPTGGQASTPAVPTPATGAFVPDYGIDSGERRIAKERKFTENGYWFARRTDPELCSLNIFQWGNPGYSGMCSLVKNIISVTDIVSFLQTILILLVGMRQRSPNPSFESMTSHLNLQQ